MTHILISQQVICGSKIMYSSILQVFRLAWCDLGRTKLSWQQLDKGKSVTSFLWHIMAADPRSGWRCKGPRPTLELARPSGTLLKSMIQGPPPWPSITYTKNITDNLILYKFSINAYRQYPYNKSRHALNIANKMILIKTSYLI